MAVAALFLREKNIDVRIFFLFIFYFHLISITTLDYI